MSPRSNHPSNAARLIEFIEALKSGSDVEAAARAAGIDRGTALEFLESVKSDLAGAKFARAKVNRGLRLIAICDGASRGNPGEAACAVIISDAGGEELLRRARRLGVAINNVAEYHGVIFAIELAETLGASELVVKLDSELVVRQLAGRYKVKNPSLKPLYEKARMLASHLHRFEAVHVPRTETVEADRLANDELDGRPDAG